MTPERLTQIRQQASDWLARARATVETFKGWGNQSAIPVDLVQSLDDALAAVTAERDEANLRATTIAAQANTCRVSMEAAQARADRLERERDGFQAASHQLMEDIKRLEQQLAHQSEHLSDCVTSESALSQDLDKACGRVRQAEASVARLEQQLTDLQAEHNAVQCVPRIVHKYEIEQAETQLATLKDKLKEWDVVGLLNTYACSATANKLAALLAAPGTGSEPA